LRIATVALPPLPPARVAAAAAFALEDELAAPPGTQLLVASPQAADGRVRVVVVDRALALALGTGPWPATRAIPEPELAAPIAGWRWCLGEGCEGFVRREDGAAFPVGAIGADVANPESVAKARLGQGDRFNERLAHAYRPQCNVCADPPGQPETSRDPSYRADWRLR
jgi:hypothetical protein